MRTIQGRRTFLKGAAMSAAALAVPAHELWPQAGSVEKTIAPRKIIVVGAGITDPGAKSDAVPITRPLCPYPDVARYKGHGDINAAENFECAETPTQ
jgi:hypothetical protein